MKPPEYADFDLELSGATGGGYVARVISSPRGEASAPVSIPVQGAELENVILKLGRTRSGVRSLSSPQAQLARSFGSQLFDAVFAEEVGTTFRRCLDDADNDGTGLRIRLRLAGVPELCDIPWEYLYSTSLGRFLVLSGRTPLVRYLDLSRRVPPLRVSPPLRILLVVSAPTDLAALDHEDEVSRMRDVLGNLVTAGSVIIDPVPKPTLGGLRLALRRGEYHVLHFIGHGGYDEAAGDGVLAFEDEHQRSHLVTGGDLGTLLHDHRTLRLVVLNACEGARQSPTDPFSGVAQSLVRQGLPAVVAMQFEITDGAALALGQEFYAAIADGYPIDAALAEARLAVFSSDNDVEWGTPVLYLRAQDGRIFDITTDGGQPAKSPPSTASRQPTSAQPTPVAQPTIGTAPQPSGGLREDPDYTPAMAAYFTRRWDRAVALLTALDSRHPGDASVGARLDEARRRLEQSERESADRKRVTDLIADLRALHAAGQWAAVVAAADQLVALDPGAADPDGLVSAARTALAEADDADRYERGLRHLDMEDWEEAKRVLEALQRDRPDYRDTALLLVRAEMEIHFAKGVRAQEARQWSKAIWRYRAVLRADPSHVDARRRLAACTAEAERHVLLVRLRDGLVARQEALAQADRPPAQPPKRRTPTTRQPEYGPTTPKPAGPQPPVPEPAALRHGSSSTPIVAKHVLDVGQWVVAIAPSPDGRTLALGCRKWLRLYDLGRGKQTWQVAATSWLGEVGAVAYHPLGSRIAARSGSEVTLWDAGSGVRIGSFEHGGGMFGGFTMAFTAGGSSIVVLAESMRTGVFDVDTGEKLSDFHHESWTTGRSSLSADGNRFAVPSGRRIKIYDTRSGETVHVINRAPGLVALSGDGGTIAILHNHSLQLRETTTGSVLFKGKAEVRTIPTAMVFSHDGARLYVCCPMPQLYAIDLPG